MKRQAINNRTEILSKYKISLAVGLCAFFLTGAAQSKRWVLPVADGGGVVPSPPSVHGYLISAGHGMIVVKRDSRDAQAGIKTPVQLLQKTDLFTAFGGLVSSNQFRPGQYVWIWYVSADPAKAGTPPHAASVVVWSLDPDERPTSATRWSYDNAK
jgi:hypothetical protein